MAAVYSNPTRGFNPNTHALFGCGAQPGLSRLLMQELFASIPEAARERPVAIGEMIDSVLVHLQQPPGASYPLFESFFEPHEAPAQAKPHLLHHPAEWGNVIVIQKHGTAFLTGYAYAGEDALLGRALSEVAGRVALHMPAVTRLWVQTHHEQTFGDQPSLARFKDIDIDGTPLRLGPGEWRRRGFELGRPTEFDAFAPRHLRDETLTLGALPDFTLAQSFLLDKGFRTRQALPLKKREPIDLNLYGNRLQLHPIGPGYATVTGELPLGNDINAWMELLRETAHRALQGSRLLLRIPEDQNPVDVLAGVEATRHVGGREKTKWFILNTAPPLDRGRRAFEQRAKPAHQLRPRRSGGYRRVNPHLHRAGMF